MNFDVTVAGDSLSEAWLRTTLALADLPDRKAFHTVTRIRQVREEVPHIRAVADNLLSTLDLPGVETVANTIFPAGMAARTPDVHALAKRYEALYPTLKRLEPNANGTGTYFLRLVAYPGTEGPVNQLARTIRALKVESATRGPKSARYEVSLETSTDSRFDEAAATPIYVPGLDNSPMGFPCLSFVSFQLDGGRLHALAQYRYQYLVRRGYGNYLGLARLMTYMADQAELSPGRLTVVVGRAYGDKLNLARIGNLKALTQRALAERDG